MNSPQVIFLDAVGTLFGIQGSVGEIYQKVARSFGVDVPASHLNRSFVASFKASSPLAFPDKPQPEVSELEFLWWQNIAVATFQGVGMFEHFSNFSAFFSQLYAHFATTSPWFVYPDVLLALEKWSAQGIELGIISNFDTRIYPLLHAFGMRDFFQSVTISSAVGAAKPAPKIFAVALEKHNCSPQAAVHIGDSLEEDYYGAKAVGITPFLLDRKNLSLL